MRRRLGVFVVTLLSLGFAAPSLAATVYPNTGSFFLDFTDMPKTSGTGQNMIVERVYNSTTYTRGIFGTGWGSWFEERLEVRDDGALVVHEWGSGASNVFTPTPPATTRSKDAILAEVMTAAEKTGEFGSESDRTAYRAWAADRVDLEWERFREYGLVKPPEIPVGATFTSSRFGNQVITRVAEGYQRESPGTSYHPGILFEAYDLLGRLQRVWDLDHAFIALRYDSRGRLAEMDDNGRNRFVFELSADGLVQRITDSQGRVAFYEYQGDELVKSVDASGDTKTYEYDDPNNNNMTALHFADKTSIEVTYGLENAYVYVERFKDRDKSVTTYKYAFHRTATGCAEGVDITAVDSAGKSKTSHEDYTVSIDQCG